MERGKSLGVRIQGHTLQLCKDAMYYCFIIIFLLVCISICLLLLA